MNSIHNILTIAKLTLRLAFRRGTLWGVLALISVVMTSIFMVSSGDSILINEIKLRVQYSYSITYSLLTLVIIFVSCFTIRSQLDGRQMHMLTSYPISRKEIWLGQWLGVVGIVGIAELALFICLGLCCIIYSQSYPAGEIEQAKNYFGIIRHESHPIQSSLKELTNRRIETMISEKRLDPTNVDESVRKTIISELLKEQQLIPPHGEKTWKFDLKRRPIYGEDVKLKFKFYAESKRKPIQGTWLIHAPGKVESHEEDFEVFPFSFNTINVPLAQIPSSGVFEVTLKGKNERDIIVGRKTGLRVYYQDGSLLKNVFKAFAFQLTHLAVTAAVGLTAGVALTFAVASFVSIVLYIMSISSGFFEVIIQGISQEYQISLADKLAVYAIQSGLWMTKGLHPPSVISSISSGISIPTNEMLWSWFPAVFIYGLLAACLGIVHLTQKELDKILI